MVLTNSQYEQLMSGYYDRQLKSNHIMESRQQEVREAIPEIQELDQQIRLLSYKHALARLGGEQDSLDLASEIQKIRDQKNRLLSSHGFTSDYLKPVYECEDCQDTGYIDGVKCHCFEKEIVRFLYSQSNLQDILEHENFSQFRLEYYPDDYTEEATGQTPRDNMLGILDTVKSFLANFSDNPDTPDGHGNLLLYGNTGVGKTFLTNCIAKELLDRSYTVVYLTSLKLFDILEKNKFRKQEHATLDEQIAYILASDLLIIDDLGTELSNSFTASQLYYLIEERRINHRSTIISTNLSFSDIRERYSERILSRFIGYYDFKQIVGEDIRIQKVIRK